MLMTDEAAIGLDESAPKSISTVRSLSWSGADRKDHGCGEWGIL